MVLRNNVALLLLVLTVCEISRAHEGVPLHTQLPELLPLPLAKEHKRKDRIFPEARTHGVSSFPDETVAAAAEEQKQQFTYPDGTVVTLLQEPVNEQPQQQPEYQPMQQIRTVTHYTGNLSANWVGEYNPLLSGGTRGSPGIRIRLNMRTFQWASALARQLIDQQLPRFKIPDIQETISEFNGQITVCNVCITRFRPPCNVAIYPSAPNHILVAVDDLDIGVTGNLDGMVNILLPIKINGIVQANLYHVSLHLSLTIGRSPTGDPCIIMDGCQVTIGYVDVCIENGGLIGCLINMLFRQQINARVKSMIPDRICSELPKIIAEKINPKLQSIPQVISFNDIASVAQSLLQSNVPAYCNSPACQSRNTPATPPIAKKLSHRNETEELEGEKEGKEEYSNPFAHLNRTSTRTTARRMRYKYVKKFKTTAHLAKQFMRHRAVRQVLIPVSVPVSTTYGRRVLPRRYIRTQNAAKLNNQGTKRIVRDRPAAAQKALLRPKAVTITRPLSKSVTSVRPEVLLRNRTGAPQARGTAVALANPAPVSAQALDSDPCAGCPSNDGLSMMKDLLISALDLRKLSDLVLTIQLMSTYATNFDYMLDLNGEFSPGGVGDTPFGPYPLMFPPTSNKMADILISDFTINSLLYQMHKKGFLTFLVNSQTPKIGDLLRTTCGEEAEEDLTSVETDTSEEKRRKRLKRLKHLRHASKRSRRQAQDSLNSEGSGGLSDLGICVGDIMPEVREKWPNKTLTLFIHSARPPSLIFSGNGGGMITVDLILLIDILVDGTSDRAGTLTATIVLDIGIQFIGTRISAVLSLREFKLQDKEDTLGLPQDALDNIANMAKEMIVKGINDFSAQGITVTLPSLNLPIRIIDPEVHIIDHALLISTDLDVSPTLFSSIFRRR